MVKNISITDKRGQVFDVAIEWDQKDGFVLLHLVMDGLTGIKASKGDLFISLIEIRKVLEGRGLFILCLGSAINVYPSRMSRQMSKGLKAYKLKLGEPASPNDLVDIFDPAIEEEVGSISEQKDYFDKWIKSLRK
jgi:hypothetical protein